MKQIGGSRDFLLWIDQHEELLTELAGFYDEEVYLYIFALNSKEENARSYKPKLEIHTNELAMDVARQLRQEVIQQGV